MSSNDKPSMPQSGMYIPPAKMQMMLENMETDKSSQEYQRLAWETLKKSINGLINKANIANIAFVVQEIFRENLVRGRGILAQYVMRAQVNSPLYTNIYASMMAVVNSKFPRNGELLLRRLIIQFRKAYRRNDKNVSINSSKFLAHLINQNIAHELLALEILTLLLQNPTNDSVEVAISFLKECGQKLSQVSPKGANAVFERLRNILHDALIEKRVQYMVEVMFAIRKDGYKDFPSIVEDLDLVEEEDQITHLLRLDDNGSTEDILNVFKYDPNYEENEQKYASIKREILDDDDSDSDDDIDMDMFDPKDSDDESESDEEDGNQAHEILQEADGTQRIIDKTETDLVALRRTIYLVIQSSLDYEECAHKMLKIQVNSGNEHEFCAMILDCCMQQKTYEKFYGLLSQRFCQLKTELMEQFMKLFKEQYETCHRLDTLKLRNLAKLYAHLLYNDAILWTIFEIIKINEDDTSSSSRIFLKLLFQELNMFMGLENLKKRLTDEMLEPYFQGIFPKNNPRNTRFAINFFTAIGLGGLTENLREFLKQSQNNSTLAGASLSGPTPLHPLLVQAAKVAQASQMNADLSDSQEETDSNSSDNESYRNRKFRQKSKSTYDKDNRRDYSRVKKENDSRDHVKTENSIRSSKKSDYPESSRYNRNRNRSPLSSDDSPRTRRSNYRRTSTSSDEEPKNKKKSRTSYSSDDDREQYRKRNVGSRRRSTSSDNEKQHNSSSSPVNYRNKSSRSQKPKTSVKSRHR